MLIRFSKYLVIFIFLTNSYLFSSDKNCISCHSNFYTDIASRCKFLHEPFEKKLCSNCHTVAPEALPLDSEIGLRRKKRIGSGRNVKRLWFPPGFHLIPIDPGYFKVTLKDIDGDEIMSKDLEPDDIITVKKISTTPVQLKWFKVLGVSRGIFITARIAWETNKPTTGKLLYKVNGEEYILDYPFYSDIHILEISDVKFGKKYTFSVLSEDVLGRRSEYGPFYFKIDSFFEENIKNKKEGSDCGLIRINNRLFLAVKSSSEIVVELYKKPFVVVEKIKKHPILVSKEYSSIKACYQCHPPSRLGASHPVGIVVKGSGMIITCASCHFPHGGNFNYLLKNKQEVLCNSCHKYN